MPKNRYEGAPVDTMSGGTTKKSPVAGSGNNVHERDSTPKTPVLKVSHNDPGPSPFKTTVKSEV